MEEKDTHPLLFRQGVDHLPDQLPGFLPRVGKLRLIFNAVILDAVFKIFPLLFCLHLGKQHGVLLNQHIFGGIGHDPSQPSREGLRFRQHIQPCKCPDVGFLQHILGGLFIFHILKGQIIFTLVSGFIEKPVSSLIPLPCKGHCLFIIHVFPPACRGGFSAGLLSNYKMRVTFRQCFPSFPMAFNLRRTIRQVFRFPASFSGLASISWRTRRTNHRITFSFPRIIANASGNNPDSSCCRPTLR